MPFVIIGVIVLVAIHYCKTSTQQQVMTDRIRSQRTNLLMQTNIEATVRAKIRRELEELMEAGALREEGLQQLHIKYNIPTREDLEGSGLKPSTKSDLYENLVTLMTRKEVQKLGFKYSYNGKPSREQEAELNRMIYNNAVEKYKDIFK